MFVVIGTTVVRKAAFAFDNFMKNQKEIQDRYPQSRLVVATDEPDFEKELKEYLRKYSVEGDVITYETTKPDYAKSRMSSNSIHSGVKLENYVAMVKAIRGHGKYPLSFT